MSEVLHLLSHAADLQTRQIHRMLVDGLGIPTRTKTVGGGGELRNLPIAVLRLRRESSNITCAWGIPALAAAVLAGHRRIIFSPDHFAGPRSLRWIRSLMGRSERSRITMVSPTFTQQRLAISNGIDPKSCRVIPPGVDFGRLRSRRESELRSQLGLSPADYVIAVPGESTVQSSHDQAVWTCGILNVLDPSWKLLLWGRGPRANTVAGLGDRLRQPDMVKVGISESRPSLKFDDLLSAADACLVTASRACPTLPIATVMAAGVPIVSTVTYAVAELLEDRHTALMVPRSSPRALALRMMDLRKDPALAAKLADTARAEAYEHFSMTRMLDAYRRLFSDEDEPVTGSGVPVRGGLGS